MFLMLRVFILDVLLELDRRQLEENGGDFVIEIINGAIPILGWLKVIVCEMAFPPKEPRINEHRLFD